MDYRFNRKECYERYIQELEDRIEVLTNRGIRRVSRDELYQHNTAFWDIEATGLRASFDRLLCVGIKPIGKPAYVIRLDDFDEYKERLWDDEHLAKSARDMLNQYTFLVGYNSRRYDLRFLNSRLAKYGLAGVEPSIAHVDVLQTMRRRFRLSSNRLDAVLTFFKTKAHKTPLAPEMWARGESGDREAMDYIVKHNIMDLVTLEELVTKKLPKEASLLYGYER